MTSYKAQLNIVKTVGEKTWAKKYMVDYKDYIINLVQELYLRKGTS